MSDREAAQAELEQLHERWRKSVAAWGFDDPARSLLTEGERAWLRRIAGRPLEQALADQGLDLEGRPLRIVSAEEYLQRKAQGTLAELGERDRLDPERFHLRLRDDLEPGVLREKSPDAQGAMAAEQCLARARLSLLAARQALEQAGPTARFRLASRQALEQVERAEALRGVRDSYTFEGAAMGRSYQAEKRRNAYRRGPERRREAARRWGPWLEAALRLAIDEPALLLNNSELARRVLAQALDRDRADSMTLAHLRVRLGRWIDAGEDGTDRLLSAARDAHRAQCASRCPVCARWRERASG